MTEERAIKGHQLLMKINMMQAAIDADIKFFVGEHWSPVTETIAMYRLPDELNQPIKELIQSIKAKYEKELEEL